MKNSILKININKEDNNLNDYLFCWDTFGQRPNKTTIFQSFAVVDFHAFLEKHSVKPSHIFTEIYPVMDDNLINRKILSQLTNEIFIGYTEYDIEVEDSLVNEVHLFHKNPEDQKVIEIIEELSEIPEKFDIDEEKSDSKSFILTIGQTGFEINPSEYLKYDKDNIDLYFNENTLRQVSKLKKNIKNNKKGLSIVHGERGVGKSTLINHMVNQMSKKSLFIPCAMFESTINNPDFRNFLNKNPDTILILDDSEIFFSEIYSKSNIFTNNLLQIVDGLDSDSLSIHIVVILNVNEISEIDHILFECNNLIDVIEVGKLESEKVKELSNHLGKKIKSRKDSKLVDVLRKKNFLEIKSDIGFI
jgi:energy-coupling factor transporter ATP-binding protein EcfA2